MSQSQNDTKKVEDWTVEDVGQWLINIGYEKYKDSFIGIYIFIYI